MKTTSTYRMGLACLSLLAAFSVSLHAQMNYQGRLTDSTGGPLTDGQWPIKFSLHTAATGGSKVWGQLTQNVDLIAGRFNTVIPNSDGSVLLSHILQTSSPRYLQIEVNGAPILPRQQILSAPRALTAESAAQLGDGTVTANSTADTVGINGGFGDNTLYVRAKASHGTVLNIKDENAGRLLEVSRVGETFIEGKENGGTSAALSIVTSGSNPEQRMLIDGNEITSNGTLFINNNGGNNHVQFGTNDVHVGINTTPNEQIALYIRGGQGDVGPICYMADSAGSLKYTFSDDDFRVVGGADLVVTSGDAFKTGSTSWSNWSDRRLKKDVRSYEHGLAEIMKLETVRYRYKEGNALALPSDTENIGFIAQDVAEVIPEAVEESSGGYLSIDVDPIHWASVNAIQELAAENAALKENLATMQKQMASLSQAVATLQAASTTPVAQN